ncbi:MAG: type I 3-dehydroquinate dehydratase [Acidobacteriota bacterium]
MICVSAGNINFTELTELLKSAELTEIRLDLNDFSDEELITIFTSSAKTIATCRPGRFTEEERIRKLILCMESGASFVDIELETEKNSFKRISELSKKYNCSLIISHHNFEKTPPLSELKDIYSYCSEKGADIIKISTLVKDPGDNAKLLSLYGNSENSGIPPLIVIGMGEKGKITRVSAPFLGAPFTYASTGRGKETAEGQIGKSDLEKIYRLIKDEQ